MANNEIPFLNWLSIKQTQEEEFQMEVDTREILNSDNLEEIRLFCATLYKENWAKDQLLKSCLGRIGELEGIIIKNRKNNFLIKKLFRS